MVMSVYFPSHGVPCTACTNSQHCSPDATTLADVESAFQGLRRLVRLVDAADIELCRINVLDQAAFDACR